MTHGDLKTISLGKVTCGTVCAGLLVAQSVLVERCFFFLLLLLFFFFFKVTEIFPYSILNCPEIPNMLGTIFRHDQTQRKYHLDKHSPTFSTFPVTLILNAVILFFHRTLRLMMLYFQTKLGCKSTSSLENTTEIVIFCL